MSKLAAYFSAGGVTADAARQLAEVTGADLHEIVPAVKYTDADLNWMDRNSCSSREFRDETFKAGACRKADRSERIRHGVHRIPDLVGHRATRH